MTKQVDTDGKLAEFTQLVERALDGALPARADSTDCDFGRERLLDAMAYSLHTPGKRIRPLLLLCAADAVGADATAFARFACGVEMIHAYSLVHDDLPAMDDDDLRRGQPTNHVVYGEGMAILAGDGLLTHAAVVMMEPVAQAASSSQMTVAREIMIAAGCDGMVGGQAADLMAEGREPQLDLLAGIHRRKTGALIWAAVRGGALLGGANEKDSRALDAFGRRYGLAFQIADDVKDEVAPTEVSGKRPGGDREAGKMTYPSLLGVDESIARCRTELAAAIAELDVLGDRADALVALAADSIAPALAGRGS